MRKEVLANLKGKIDLGTLEALIKRRFRVYPKLERERIYCQVADYFLDKCREHDPTHTSPEEVDRAYNEARIYLKKLKIEMDEKKENLKSMLNKFINDED